MSAPIDAYRTIGLKDKKNSTDIEEAKEQDVAVAKPASEYVSSGTLEQQMQQFKDLFYLDDVKIVPHQVNSSTREDGIIGLVKVTTETDGNVYPASDNAKHHNITNDNPYPTTQPSRLSRLRTKLDGEEYAVLNEGGLNTMADIRGQVVACYKNAIIAKAIVKSAYYASTKSNMTMVAKIKNASQGLLGTENMTSNFAFSTIPSKESQIFESSLLVFQSAYNNARYVVFESSVENNEGTYNNTSKPQDVFNEYIYHPFIYGKLFTTIPTSVDELKAGESVPMMMSTTQDGLNPLDGVTQVESSSAHPVIYRDAYLSHIGDGGRRYLEGVYLTDMVAQSDTSTNLDTYKFYLIGDVGQVRYYTPHSYERIMAYVSFDLIYNKNLDNSTPEKRVELTAAYHNVGSNPSPITLTGTIKLVNSSGQPLSSGIKWKGTSGVNRDVTITLTKNGVTGMKVLWFEVTDPNKEMYLTLVNSTQGGAYPVETNNRKFRI